jgi:hypothetical protein
MKKYYIIYVNLIIICIKQICNYVKEKKNPVYRLIPMCGSNAGKGEGQ